MASVREILESPEKHEGHTVVVEGLLLGGSEHQFIADSIDEYDRQVALPILDAPLFERLFERGVSPIGGGRFCFRYNAIIQGELANTTDINLKYGVKNVTSLVVFLENGRLQLSLSE